MQSESTYDRSGEALVLQRTCRDLEYQDQRRYRTQDVVLGTGSIEASKEEIEYYYLL